MKLSDWDPDLKAAFNEIGMGAGNVRVLFVRDEILHSQPHEIFNYAFDCGVFLALAPKQKEKYVEAVYKRVWTGGYLFLKCFPQDLKIFEKRFYFRKQIREKFFILRLQNCVRISHILTFLPTYK